ncbi:MAG TPA: flagellar type III secretion system protein FlhB, partial [Burkholderiales bacterium]|nr:flagellar type III secretion system protein FlhB [Burkholderiales bacterium]
SAVAMDTQSALIYCAALVRDAALGVLPLLGLLVIAALVGPLLLNGWIISAAPLSFDVQRLNPLAGIGRMFSSSSLVELAKAIAKALLIGGLGVWALWSNLDALVALTGVPLQEGAGRMGALVGSTSIMIVCGVLAIAAIDVPYQLWTHHQKLRMTREEIRQEARETEGDPLIKGHIRRMQREVARRRMMAEVPHADVVVTNPLRFAVALRYESATMRAPRVVAKGTRLLAQRIRELAEEHGVTVLAAPPLARALYHHTELGDEIPATLYTTVAEVLAYVFQLRRYRELGGAVPSAPQRFDVPPGLDPEAAS